MLRAPEGHFFTVATISSEVALFIFTQGLSAGLKTMGKLFLQL